jgi:hypothetical protein
LRLKWDSICATIYDGMDADQAESAEIDANLIPADLSPADQALHVDARKTLYEKLHPRRSNLVRPVRILSSLANQSALAASNRRWGILEP